MPTDSFDEQASKVYESTHVHSVYDQIAPHFSQTRHKPWPLITRFLLALPPGSVGLDIGCGNGKYLNLNPNIFIVGSDRAKGLVGIAKKEKKGRSNDLLLGDILDLPHGRGIFDFAISIAVVHHLSTRERRIHATASILETLKSGRKDVQAAGKALIYVWALEQRTSRRGWGEGDEQDVMVPWVTKRKTANGEAGPHEQKFERYYHLYRRGELDEDVRMAGGIVVESGYEKDNWWAIASPHVVD